MSLLNNMLRLPCECVYGWPRSLTTTQASSTAHQLLQSPLMHMLAVGNAASGNLCWVMDGMKTKEAVAAGI